MQQSTEESHDLHECLVERPLHSKLRINLQNNGVSIVNCVLYSEFSLD